MKKLGLVGGMGPESTIPYYHDIMYGVRDKTGKHMFPEMTIESVDVFKVLDLCAKERYEQLTDYLEQAVSRLAACGADFAALAANTPHIVFDRLRECSPIPLVSIVEATAEEARRRNLTRLGLLGTMFTMNGEFYRTPFTERGVTLVTPHDAEKNYIAEKIANELEFGIVKEDTRAGFVKIMQRLRDENTVQAVILGCTELPLLFLDAEPPMEILDTMKIHTETLVDMIVSGEEGRTGARGGS